MASKQSPLERIAEEMGTEQDHIGEKEILAALTGLMHHLRKRAADAIIEDEHSKEALVAARQYWAYAALIDQFGGSLIAYDDIEEEELGSAPATEPLN